MSDLTWILISALLINNFTLSLFLGLCPFFGVTGKVETAVRLGAANIFVMVLTAVAVWFLNRFILAEAPFLRIISFVIVIASLVQIVEMVIRKASPVLFRALGIYLPLITTNCAIFGLGIFQTNRGYTLVQGVVFAIGGGLGMILALALMASIRERLDLANVPSLARGFGISLIIASCLSLAFMGFAGLGAG